MNAATPIQVDSSSEEQTVSLARGLAGALLAGDFVALHGELGAGKTRFVRGLALGLGHDPQRVSSPTFVLAHVYDELAGRLPLVHVDAYRLTSGEDLPSLGWDRMADGSGVVVVEWAQRIADALPPPGSAVRFDVTLEHAGEQARRITIVPPPDRKSMTLSAISPVRARRCRVCGGSVDRSGEFGAFCSERCRMADLGKWFSGDYSISRDAKESDLET